MNNLPTAPMSDRDCLVAWRRDRRAEDLQPLVARYLPLVYASALRRTSNVERAVEVTRAVFAVLARRARKLSKTTVMCGWLFEVTGLVAKKAAPPTRWFRRHAVPAASNEPPLPPLLREIDPALQRLSRKSRNAVLLCTFLGHTAETAAAILRTSEARAVKRIASGTAKLARGLHKRAGVNESQLLGWCQSEGTKAVHEMEEEIMSVIRESRKRPTLKLARRALFSLAMQRWFRRFSVAAPGFMLVLFIVGMTLWRIDARAGHSHSIATFLIWSSKNEARTVPGLAEPARPWPTNDADLGDARSVRSAADLYQTTNIWQAHLTFSREQWKALEPKDVGVLPNFIQPDGTALLRNPKAQRSGLAGVLGFDFDWTHAELDFSGVKFTNVAARVKGNGTYLASLYGDKRAFKVDLNKFAKGQKLGDADELTFNNLVIDHSYMSDALAYEFFRDAGVPAPRTAYAWLTVTVKDQWERKPLGLYAMVEPVDEAFAKSRFGSGKTPIFKPVTYQLFEDMGDKWDDYAAIYDLKTKATAAQQQRVVDFAKLVSHATDEEFAARVGDFLDLDNFARFMAGLSLTASYDSFLANGQNFYVYLDPRSNKFGFIPWDMDLAWGGFFLLGSQREREQSSIFHPWVGKNRLLERVFAVEAFRRIHRAHLEDFSKRLLVPERLAQRVDEMAAVVRGPVTAESDFRLRRFEQAIGERAPDGSTRQSALGAGRPAHQLKRFIEKRAASVRAQLDGKEQGMIFRRGGR